MRPSQPPPDPVYELLPDGREWRPDEGWRLATAQESKVRRCRRPGCRRAPVAALRRSNGWWLYCDWHLYGRRIVDGRIEWQHRAEVET